MIINEANSSALAATLNRKLRQGMSEKEVIDFILSIDRKIYCEKKLGEWENGLPSIANFKNNVVKSFSKLNKDKNISAKDFVDQVVSAMTKSEGCTVNDISYDAYHYCQVNGISYNDWLYKKSASVVNESAKVNYFDY